VNVQKSRENQNSVTQTPGSLDRSDDGLTTGGKRKAKGLPRPSACHRATKEKFGRKKSMSQLPSSTTAAKHLTNRWESSEDTSR